MLRHPSDPRAAVGELERFEHRQYEMLRAPDQLDQEEVQAALRDWHNRALHTSYGVVFGLVVDALLGTAGSSTPGRWYALVPPGLAYDARGTAIVVARTYAIPLPDDPEGMTLVVRPGAGDPSFQWRPTRSVRFADGVALARTFAVTPVRDVKFKANGSLPPELADKVEIGPGSGAGTITLTIHGLLSEAEFGALSAALADDSKPLLTSAYSAWPFEAPQRSRSIVAGLHLTISKITDDNIDGLWRLDVTPGSALTDRGELIRLASPVSQTLTESGKFVVVLQADPDPRKQITLQPAPPTGNESKVELGTIKLSDRSVGLPIPIASGGPGVIAIRDGLVSSGKVSIDSDQTIRITGFLSRTEADQLIDLVGAVDVGTIGAAGDLIDKAPVRKDASFDPVRPPFFPKRSRALARPRTSTGSSIPGRTDWKLCSLWSGTSPAPPLAFETKMNYEAAGFTEVPQVFAWLDVPTPDQVALIPGDSDSQQRATGSEKPRWLRSQIDDQRVTSHTFVFRVFPQGAPPDAAGGDASQAWAEYLRQNYYVRWLAVQAEPPPVARFIAGGSPLVIAAKDRE